MTIWKYEVPITDRFVLEVPGFKPKVLSFALDPGGKPCVWIMVNPEQPTFGVRFALVGTGNPLPAGAEYWEFVGNVQQYPFMWHLFVD